jgi:hypothetical protein
MEPNTICDWCHEAITEQEQRAPITGTAMHWECGLRTIVGGLNHLNGLCSCSRCHGALPPDPESTTRRNAARLAAQAWIARHPRPNER